MVGLMAPWAVRSPLLKTSPCLRIAAYQCRSFSASTTHKYSLVDLAVTPPNAIMETIHGLGVPWYATLPLTAAVVRGTFVYYFSMRPARKMQVARAQLMPLVSATRIVQMGSNPRLASSDRARRLPLPLRQSYRWASQLFPSFRLMLGIQRTFGLRGLGGKFLVNFGTLIAFTEAIRIKCGARNGLLTAVLYPFEWLGRKIAPDWFDSPPSAPSVDLSSAEMLAQRLEKARELKMGATTSTSSEQITRLQPLDGPNVASPHFESTLQTEGLSWCTDLTLADPTLALPVALSSTFALTLLLRPTLRNKKISPGKGSIAPPVHESALTPETARDLSYFKPPRETFLDRLTTLQRIGLCLSIVLGFAATKLPAAILLYFIPSIAIGWLQNRWLEYRFPTRKPIQACSRRVRLKVMNPEWTA